MAVVSSPLSEAVQRAAGQALQGALVDLIDLSLTAKQAHWNVTGRTFKTVHEHLDEVVATVREASDSVAERAMMIGVHPDGRVRTVADGTVLAELPPGAVPEDKAVSSITEALAVVIARFRDRIAATEDEPVTQDLLIGITAELEKHHWMFAVQR
ncbi:starvation-inducible DNA-binding protein [Actinocorallia herbida]|uniref:Starvation-inducible DNA-binding protein n=2 Tax=Actinocorallia herbida TaxID=58109 RepID=A0A3N1CQK8_9ACTN|nr:starvation-inducible DNA-binding protein [Actinocorallia herbida]